MFQVELQQQKTEKLVSKHTLTAGGRQMFHPLMFASKVGAPKELMMSTSFVSELVDVAVFQSRGNSQLSSVGIVIFVLQNSVSATSIMRIIGCKVCNTDN